MVTLGLGRTSLVLTQASFNMLIFELFIKEVEDLLSR